MIKVYDLAGAEEDLRFSPNCWRVKMALKHKGLTFEAIPWRFVEKDAIAFSGQKTVPVLVDGDQTIIDSWSIACYLEAAYPEHPSLFGGSVGMGTARWVKFWCEQELHSILFKIILPDLFERLHEKDKPYFRQTREARFGKTLEQIAEPTTEAVATLRKRLSPLRATLEQQPYLSGVQPSFADYLIFGALMWARSVSPIQLLEPTDSVYLWRDRLLDSFDGYARSAPGYPS
ncbi:glutathione S-transferase family protein [Anthocerotibacter panamensis]|uniref:glutathione S-transferase family protein n=1 Tax=Anthocerotibacter panamensis TaxID=2857077 RepID=UPI001C407B72|nr:glutathione S-transferase family protein [Anthocerotibacter panamensis]